VIYHFDDCELDPGRIVFRRGGEEVALEPQVFDLLHCLIGRRGQLVTKEELLDTVWGDRFVSESALTSRIKSARRAVGDDGTAQRIIRTVHGKGYEFVAPVIERDDLDHATTDQRPHAPASTSTHPSAIPLAVHDLVGRGETLDELESELREARCLTIIGPGGVGKTSLALEVARRTASTHRDGVALVELVGVGTADEALAAVATALDVSVRQHESIDAAIIDVLRPQQLLLVLDNCEHLVGPVANLVEQILHTSPDVTTLTTSRETLAIAGERVYHVEPLDVTDLDELRLHDLALDDLAAIPAVRLFVERARAADARFQLTAANARSVAEICRRLDGIPLALELAASRTAALDVSDIARRLDERLRLLQAVRRGSDPRHRRLLDTISWSYELLDEDERRIFAELAVFAGPFDLDAAEAVCDERDVLDLLTRLSQRSMLAVRRPASGGTRYEMLETLREFGRSRLDDMSNVALFGRHAAHFASAAKEVEAAMQTVDEPVAVRRVDAAFADLRAAQRFAADVGDADTALGLVTSIREYAMRTMRYEVFAWADAAMGLVAQEAHPLRPTLTGVSAYGAWVRGEFDRALEMARTALDDEAAQGLAPLGLAERVLGNVLYIRGDIEDGAAMIDRLIPIAEASGNGSRRVHAYYMSSISAVSIGDVDLARTRYEAAFDIARETGSPTDLASAWTAKGFATRNDDAAALDAFASGDRLARSAGNRWMSAFACTEASSLRICMGDLARGCAGLAETVDAWYRAGEWAQQWLTLSRCLIALDRLEQYELAAELLGAIEHHSSVDAPPGMPSVLTTAVDTRESLLERFGSERAAELGMRGIGLPLVELVNRTRNALLARPA
jgi:predicted ATPase/DNA-binding winged helix-turn-helix (wHTH) protein